MIAYCLVSRENTMVGEYGVTMKDYSQDVMRVVQANSSRLGTRFITVPGLFSCALLNQKHDDELYSIVVVTESAEHRDQAFDCLDIISSGFEVDRRSKKAKDALVRVPKHMRSAMVWCLYLISGQYQPKG